MEVSSGAPRDLEATMDSKKPRTEIRNEVERDSRMWSKCEGVIGIENENFGAVVSIRPRIWRPW